MSESEPIRFRPRLAGPTSNVHGSVSYGSTIPKDASGVASFNRQELNEILTVYGRMVAAGEWRDYALDIGREKAVFSVFRRASEFPIYRIEKNPKLARKQGAYSVVAATGLILKRGHDLRRVLQVLDKGFSLVEASP